MIPLVFFRLFPSVFSVGTYARELLHEVSFFKIESILFIVLVLFNIQLVFNLYYIETAQNL